MIDLITFKDITERTGMARSTILRRCKALKITATKKKSGPGPGQPARAVTMNQFAAIVEFTPDIAKDRSQYKSSAQISFAVSSAKPQSAGLELSDNIKIGLYSRITAYSGTYDSREWAV